MASAPRRTGGAEFQRLIRLFSAHSRAYFLGRCTPWPTRTNLLNSGRSTALSTSSSRTEWALITWVGKCLNNTSSSQGFQVSDDEINMDLATFRSHYASQMGSVE